LDVLALGLAWMVTAGAGAVIAGHVIARSQPPLILRAPFAAAAIVGGAGLSAAPSCPKSWEPPLVSVDDLPAAPSATAPRAAVVAQKAPLPPVAGESDAHLVAPGAWVSPKRRAAVGANASASTKRHPHSSDGLALRSATKGKSSSQSLEDWMKAEVAAK
jgi:hypothetical protein